MSLQKAYNPHIDRRAAPVKEKREKAMGETKSSAQIYVAGHKCPDTDSVVSAAVLASLRNDQQNQESDPPYTAVMQGEANRQTRWLFEEADIDLPEVLTDARAKVKEVMNPSVPFVSESACLWEAQEVMRKHTTDSVVVLDDEERFVGVISPRLPHNEIFHHFNIEDYLGVLVDFQHIASGLNLTPLSKKASPDRVSASHFQISGLKTEDSNLPTEICKTVLITTGSEPIEATTLKEYSAIIYVETSEKKAQKNADDTEHPQSYYYSGSLIAFLSSLGKALPIQSLIHREVATLKPDSIAEDSASIVANALHDIPVINSDDHVIGIVSGRELLEIPKRQVLLVDHFEKTQSLDSIEDTEVLEIIDHHRIGNLETPLPLKVDVRPVGSTATILALQAEEQKQRLTAGNATLLLGALVSDTLLLTSPTTTHIDKRIAVELATIAKLNLEEFGKTVLTLNDELADGEPESLIQRDLKGFESDGVPFGVGQVETVDLGILTYERIHELLPSMDGVRNQRGWNFLGLMVTDVFAGNSRFLISHSQPDQAAQFIEVENIDEGRFFEGFVSRKKQMLPWILERLKQCPQN